MPRISIVVPVYNVEKYIGQCLESLVNQTFKDIEIIVVDDGSPDESYKIYEKYAARDNRIKIIKKKNAGVSEARNTGIENACGDWLMFVDSDDWMELDGCEILFNAAIKGGEGVDMAVADANTVTNGVKRVNRVFKEDFVTESSDFIRNYQRACLGYRYNPMPSDNKNNVSGLGSPWNKLYKRQIIADKGLRYDSYVNGIYDDNLFTLHYLNHVNKLSYSAKPVYNYRIVSQSLTQSYKANTLDISSRIFEKIGEFMAAHRDADEFRKPYYAYVIRRLSAELGVYYFSEKNDKKLSEKLAELKNALKSEPYKTALHNVDPQMLMMAHKATWLAGYLGSPLMMYMQFWLRKRVKKLM